MNPALQGYLAAGVVSDHEITSGDDLVEKLRAGLAIEIRGSHDYVIPTVVKALQQLPHLSSQIMFCTDDVPPDVLVERGAERIKRACSGDGECSKCTQFIHQ